MSSGNYDFLGLGWSFPPSFSSNGATVAMDAAYVDIENSLRILLGTATGERVMQPDFGCNMEELVFESMDATMKTYMKDKIFTAILYNEPRIDLLDVDFEDEPGLDGVVQIMIDYQVRSTNARRNLVFPFYKNESSI